MSTAITHTNILSIMPLITLLIKTLGLLFCNALYWIRKVIIPRMKNNALAINSTLLSSPNFGNKDWDNNNKMENTTNTIKRGTIFLSAILVQLLLNIDRQQEIIPLLSFFL